MTVAIYARVSSDSQEARGTIGSQLEALRQTMSELGHQVVHEYTDDGYSGARLDRPGLDALRDAAEASFQGSLVLDARPTGSQLCVPDPGHRRVGQARRPDAVSGCASARGRS